MSYVIHEESGWAPCYNYYCQFLWVKSRRDYPLCHRVERVSERAQVSVHLAKSCSERVLEIFDAVRGFYINSAPEIMEPFGWWYSGCVYPLAFFHKPLRILHYCRRGNSGFQHADKSIRAIFDQSEHFKLTHVCSAIALFLFVGILHFDYWFCFIGLEWEHFTHNWCKTNKVLVVVISIIFLCVYLTITPWLSWA